MFPRPSFVLFLCLVVSIAFSGGKPQNSSTKQVDTAKSHPRQSFVVNNNCGLAKAEREMLAHIKAKVDSISTQSGKGSGCSDGWVAYGKSCFLVIDVPTLEWSAARRNCQKLGGDLAKITSAGENQFIFDLLLKQKRITAYGFWLGLHRKADNKFYWADGTPLTGYTAWSPGEPNSVAEKCGHIFGADPRKGKWNDISCSLAASASHINKAPVVLCEKNSK